MFYVDFDAGCCAFLGPRDDFDENQIDNRALITEVEDIVSHVARNRPRCLSRGCWSRPHRWLGPELAFPAALAARDKRCDRTNWFTGVARSL